MLEIGSRSFRFFAELLLSQAPRQQQLQQVNQWGVIVPHGQHQQEQQQQDDSELPNLVVEDNHGKW